ncbi:hypothetical protein OROHE_001374 [Orobanche hederae]
MQIKRVDVRKPSERPPVRQKFVPFRSSVWRRLGHGTAAGLDSSSFKAYPEEEGVETFFFRNFPDGCNTRQLTSKFEEVEKVHDIFLPKRKDKAGNNFGFVRFKKDEISDWEAMERLNKLWIDSFKIRVCRPRFERRRRGQEELSKAKNLSFPINSGRRQEGITFKEVISDKDARPATNIDVQRNHAVENVLSDKQNEEEQRQTAFNVRSQPTEETEVRVFTPFITKEEDKQWLKGCWTGKIKEKYEWSDIGEEIQSEWGDNIRIRFLGDGLVLIQGQEGKDISLEDTDEWRDHWFSWIRRWREEDVKQRRVAWTNWFGIPLHIWNMNFFNIASTRVGSIIEVDEKTKNKERLDLARIKMSVPIRYTLNKCLVIKVDGVDYRIRVVEEASYPWDDEEVDVYEGEDTTDSEDIESQNLENPEFPEIQNFPKEKETVEGFSGNMLEDRNPSSSFENFFEQMTVDVPKMDGESGKVETAPDTIFNAPQQQTLEEGSRSDSDPELPPGWEEYIKVNGLGVR